MNYIDRINSDFLFNISKLQDLTIFGQNIDSGSFLSGLTKGIKDLKNLRIINSTNCENTLVGFGLGIALKSNIAIYICKQQDFLLLTLDQIVNTYNSLRLIGFTGSFTIYTIVVDSGYEVPQSRLNNLSEFSSLAKLDIWNISTAFESKLVNSIMKDKGFRIIAISQRSFRDEIYNTAGKVLDICEKKVIKYFNGKETAIVCFNFSLINIMKKITQKEIKDLSVFNVINHHCKLADLAKVLKKFKKILIFDDSKSSYSNSSILTNLIKSYESNIKVYKKEDNVIDLSPNSDEFYIDISSMIES